MDMKTQGSPQRSAIQNLVNQNQRIRESLNQARKEKEELLRNLRKVQGEVKSYELKMRTVENQRQRDLGENRRFMEGLEAEKKEKIRLLTELAEVKNNSVRKDAEIVSLKSQVTNLQTENDRLRKQSQTSTLQHVTSLKQKQSTLNSLKILETKLQASQAQKKFQSNRASQLEQQLVRLREELSTITKKYHEREIGVQAIYRDQQETKQRLLEEFQMKIADKDIEMATQMQKYLNENSMLKQKIIQLRGNLH